jgi:uncharacterized membrane protein YdcZ (DUF606 family)
MPADVILEIKQTSKRHLSLSLDKETAVATAQYGFNRSGATSLATIQKLRAYWGPRCSLTSSARVHAWIGGAIGPMTVAGFAWMAAFPGFAFAYAPCLCRARRF